MTFCEVIGNKSQKFLKLPQICGGDKKQKQVSLRLFDQSLKCASRVASYLHHSVSIEVKWPTIAQSLSLAFNSSS